EDLDAGGGRGGAWGAVGGRAGRAPGEPGGEREVDRHFQVEVDFDRAEKARSEIEDRRAGAASGHLHRLSLADGHRGRIGERLLDVEGGFLARQRLERVGPDGLDLALSLPLRAR